MKYISLCFLLLPILIFSQTQHIGVYPYANENPSRSYIDVLKADTIFIEVANQVWTKDSSYRKHINATVEITGMPQIKFKPIKKFGYEIYYLAKADYPPKKDTVYTLKITAKGYATRWYPLTNKHMWVSLFKKGQPYVYDDLMISPASYRYDAPYAAVIVEDGDSTQLVNFCKENKLVIVNGFEYCSYRDINPPASKPVRCFIVRRVNSKPIKPAQLSAIRTAFKGKAGEFFYSYMAKFNFEADYPPDYRALIQIIASNKVEVYFTPDGSKDAVLEYIKKVKGAVVTDTSDYQIPSMRCGRITIQLPDDWNIIKMGRFIDGLMPLGILSAETTGMYLHMCSDYRKGMSFK